MDKIYDLKDDEVEFVYEEEKYYNFGKYKYKPNLFFKPIAEQLTKNFDKIEQMLYSSPAFIDVVKSTIPETMYNAVLSTEDKIKLAKGSVKLMASKDGKLLANLIDTKNGKIISNINLDKVSLTPELNSAIMNFTTQMQLAQITEDIKYIQLAVEEVREGQENDRLAIAYSCKQKLLQAIEIKNKDLKNIALLNLISSAEDNRNQLMLSQSANIKLLKEQPKNFIGKFLKGEEEDLKKDKRIGELRENMNALNLVSIAEVLAYQELGELEAAKVSLEYYGEYINKTYLENYSFLERLDSLNPTPQKYWSTTLPNIASKIELLKNKEKEMIEDVKEK